MEHFTAYPYKDISLHPAATPGVEYSSCLTAYTALLEVKNFLSRLNHRVNLLHANRMWLPNLGLDIKVNIRYNSCDCYRATVVRTSCLYSTQRIVPPGAQCGLNPLAGTWSKEGYLLTWWEHLLQSLGFPGTFSSSNYYPGSVVLTLWVLTGSQPQVLRL